MKRTLERLTHQRQEKESEFADALDRLQATGRALGEILGSLQDHGESLRSTAGADPSGTQRDTSSLSRFRRRKSGTDRAGSQNDLAGSVEHIRGVLAQALTVQQGLVTCLSDLTRNQAELMDARDKEWDALGSNHVGMIFKSLERRVDGLRTAYEDAALLMKTHVRLRDQLTRLQATVEKQELPTAARVRAVARPLQDVTYTEFENRYRGSESKVKKQQEFYLDYFRTDKTVLDLGCGRGEFLDLLARNGVPARGVDLNEAMVSLCREHGHDCRRGDALEALAEVPDASLGGVFSSQVIEHLPPADIRRLVDLAFIKLAPSCHIVLETLNPTSVFALVHIYFLDLSHQQPVHPQALTFLLESAGFQDVEVKYSAPPESDVLEDVPPLSDAAAAINRNVDKLNRLLFGPVNFAAAGRRL
jgi:O-antigen chain-terminating methyltransferase